MPKRIDKKKTTKLSMRKNYVQKVGVTLSAISIGVVGTILLLLTHAATSANCKTLTTTNKSALLCVNITSSNLLNGSLIYTGSTATDVLSTGKVALYTCTKEASPVCTTTTSSSTVVPADASAGRKSQIITANIAYDTSKVYKACTTLKSTTAWRVAGACTSIVTFGSGYQDGPSLYAYGATTDTAAKQEPTSPSATYDCGGQTLLVKADGSQWQCTFNDEFNGSALNRTLWNVQTTAGSGFATTDTGNNNPRACFMDTTKNVSVAGGYLSLTAAQENAAFTCTGTKTPFTTVYTAGEVQSQNKFSQQYGRFEVSAKLPATSVKGLQETFWLWPDNMTKYGAWPASGEFDFSEFYSKYNNLDVPIAHYLVDPKTVNFTSHLNTYTPVIYYDNNYNNCYINVGAFNTYVAIWRSGYLEVDVNGKPCLVDNYTATNGANPTPFDQPFFLALTQALGINAGGDNQFVPGTTPLPATTQVDYVRVWK